MPDMIVRSFWHCQSFENFEVETPSSRGDGVYLVIFGPTPFGPAQHDWSCECKGFLFRKRCKHVEAAKKSRCGWSQFGDGDDIKRAESGRPICPKCKGPVSAMNWGV